MSAATPLPSSPTVDLAAVKTRQQAIWSSGDYAVVGTTLQIVGETLCEAVDLHAGSKVLDVAAGNGNATLAAARRWCRVTSTDYVLALLEVGRARAEAEGHHVLFKRADAEHLPFADASFDGVLSTFGVMFTPNQVQAARELLRVCRPGGRIGLANWTPDGFIGQMFRVVARHLPPPPGVPSPMSWGTRAWLDAQFGPSARTIRTQSRDFVFRYRSPAHFIEVFRTCYGPVHKLYAALDAERQAGLTRELFALLEQHNRADDGTLVVPGEYMEVVIERK
ncbi:MAG: class I SAM-dependent methyltransferase [Xanthomonadales bacterium]|nr:class I SAM-dependent methyltransferase [Xanthomonadales bacterium]ODU94078.1 MAG: SAM-dependent methyltransferase [Rhodanobacter sp. SCN 66-43]OJY83958.1 MAG: SAM-dependent methyltransferase [Xanthomonadales bacterium 66-474]